MIVGDSLAMPTEHLRKLVRSRLQATGAINLRDLASFVGGDRESVARVVEALMAEGEVEILKPVGDVASNAAWSDDGVFYRMIRATDLDFVWEREVNAKRTKDGPSEIKRAWLKMLEHDADMDLSVLQLVRTMNMA